MEESMKQILLVSYLVGFAGAFYLGGRFKLRRLRKSISIELDQAFKRGWKAGYNFVGNINERKVDMFSAVRVLTGKELPSDRPFPRED